MESLTQWLLESDEPWTRYRTLVDLLERPASDGEVQAARVDMLAHPQVQSLLEAALAWETQPIKRHNDAGLPIHQLSVLADFGLNSSDPGISSLIATILAHQSPIGVLQSLVNVPQAFGGTGADQWSWMLCDTPRLLSILLAFGASQDERLQPAAAHLAALIDDNGFHCKVDPALGKFRGPGAKTDPCPIANLFALQALSKLPNLLESPAAHGAAEMLLQHWGSPLSPPGKKYYLFGIGSDFRKLKYPFIWYDILHVVDVLSRFPCVRVDPRFDSLTRAIFSQAGPDGRYTAASMYQTWKGWSFADKKKPSPWLTFLVLRVQKRMGGVLTRPV